jgi:transposase-like protein
MLHSAPIAFQIGGKATVMTAAVAMGVCDASEAVLLTVKVKPAETEEDWRPVLDGLSKQGLRQPDFVVSSGASRLESAIAGTWNEVPVQQCTDQTLKTLLALSPERLRRDITDDYNDMMFACDVEEIPARHKKFITRWRKRYRPVADALENVGDRQFAFTRLSPRPAHDRDNLHTTHAIESLFDNFNGAVSSRTILPAAETAEMLLASPAAVNELTRTLQDATRYGGSHWPTRIEALWRCFNIASAS